MLTGDIFCLFERCERVAVAFYRGSMAEDRESDYRQGLA